MEWVALAPVAKVVGDGAAKDCDGSQGNGVLDGELENERVDGDENACGIVTYEAERCESVNDGRDILSEYHLTEASRRQTQATDAFERILLRSSHACRVPSQLDS